MPIRKRNKLWQADVVTPTGQRIRRSFPTQAEAAAFVKENAPAAPKHAPRKGTSPASSRGTQSTRPPIQGADVQQKPLSPPPDGRSLAGSHSPKSPTPVDPSNISNPQPVSVCTAPSVTGSPTSALPQTHGQPSPTSPAQTVQPASSPKMSSHPLCDMPTPQRP